MNNEPERPLDPGDNLHQIKHADPYGRVNLGRRYAYQTFIVEEMTEGALLLRPAVIMEKRKVKTWRDKLGPPPGQVLCIPTER